MPSSNDPMAAVRQYIDTFQTGSGPGERHRRAAWEAVSFGSVLRHKVVNEAP